MALKVEVGTITANTATGNQTITLADTGFGTVKAVMIWGTGNSTAEADAGVNLTSTIGLGTYRGAAVQQFVASAISLDTVSTSDTGCGQSAASIIRTYSDAVPTVEADAALVSLGDASFVINWTNAPGSAFKFHYMALGGADLTDALVGTATATTAAGSDDITVASGFGSPSLIMMLSGALGTANADAAESANVGFGVGYDDSNQGSSVFVDEDARPSMETASLQKSTIISKLTVDSAVYAELALAATGSWPTDGFRLTKTTAPAAALRFGYLALKGDFTKVIGSGLAVTAGSPPVNQDLAISQTPRGAVFFHNNIAANTVLDSSHADLGMFGLGAIDGTHEAWYGVGQDDGDTTSDTHIHHSESKAIKMFIANNSSGAIQSSADGSFSGNNVRLAWDDIDTVEREYRYLLLGDAAGGGGGATDPPNMLALLGVGT